MTNILIKDNTTYSCIKLMLEAEQYRKCVWLNESTINVSKVPLGINMKSDIDVIDGRIWCEFKLYASKIVWLTN